MVAFGDRNKDCGSERIDCRSLQNVTSCPKPTCLIRKQQGERCREKYLQTSRSMSWHNGSEMEGQSPTARVLPKCLPLELRCRPGTWRQRGVRSATCSTLSSSDSSR